MSLSLSIMETTEKNIDYENEVEEMRLKVDSLIREKELLTSELKYKEKEFEIKIEESNIENLMLKKTVENLEELTKKLKEFQSFPEHSKEKTLVELQHNIRELENKLILSHVSENRIKMEYEQLMNSHCELQKEAQQVKYKRKSVIDHQNVFINEDDDLENIESLREIIIELSNEYDELKTKYQKQLDLYYDKERLLIEIKDKHNKKEDDLLNKIFEYEDHIRTLNVKISELENQDNNLLDKRPRKESKEVINYFSPRGKVLQENTPNSYHLKENLKLIEPFNEDYLENNLLEEINKKDKIIQELREDYVLNLKSIEERYINHIGQLEREVQKYQDTLCNGNEYKSILQGEISSIDETNQQMKEEIQNLRSKLKEAEIIRKNVEFSHKNQLEKLDKEIKEYILIIENSNKNKKVMEKNYKVIFQKNENLIREKEELKEKLNEKEKEVVSKIKESEDLRRDLDYVNEEKEAIKKDYKIFKEDFMNFREKYKENVNKQMDDMEFENRKLKQLIEKHKVSNRNSLIFSYSNNSIDNFKDLVKSKRKDNHSLNHEDFKKLRSDPDKALESIKKLLPIKRAETIKNRRKELNNINEDIHIENSPLLKKLNTNIATLSDILIDEFDQPCFMKKILNNEENKRSSEIFNIVEEMVNNQDARMPVHKFGSFIDIVPEENLLEIDQTNTTTKIETMRVNESMNEENRISSLKEDSEYNSNDKFELKSKIIDLETTVSILKDDKEKLQVLVKELERTIDINGKNFEKSINDIKQSNLLTNMTRRHILFPDKKQANSLEETQLCCENKIKSLDAEIEFYKNKIKIVENEYSSKNLMLENELKYIRSELEKYVFDNINLKVQLANILFEKDQEQLKYITSINKLKNYIKRRNEQYSKNMNDVK